MNYPAPLHGKPHPRADASATVAVGIFAGRVRIVDWFDRMAGRSWMLSDHPGVLIYAARREAQRLPFNDDVILVHTDDGAHALVHADELAAPAIDEALS